jgi:hypothetical protein
MKTKQEDTEIQGSDEYFRRMLESYTILPPVPRKIVKKRMRKIYKMFSKNNV